MGASPKSNFGVGADNMYAFDPATGTFLRNPGVPGAESSGSPVGTSFAGSGGDNNVPMNPQTERFLNWEETTPEGKAHREARMGEIQNLFNLGPTGAFMSALGGKEAKAPNFGTIFGTPESYESYIADKDSGIFEGRSQSGGSTRQSWENLPADMRGGSNGFAVGSDGGPASGYGVDSWSGNMDSYAGSGIDQGDRGEAAGGLITLAKGGMASGGFVVPADVVSALGNGSTDAGLRSLNVMLGKIKPIKGKGDGLSDSIPTNIDGKQPARVADGEAYIDPKTVKRLGGAKKLYAMMDKVRAQAHGKTTQQRKVNPARVMA
jgi:hypothetical protein